MEIVRSNLAKNGYGIDTTGSIKEALIKVKSQLPSLVLLNSSLPKINTIEFCKKLKGDSKTEHIPIIMITDGDDKSTVPTESMIDDYIPQPIAHINLLAKIKRILHRSIISNLEKAPLAIHELTLYPARQQVLIETKPVDLTPAEFNILYVLAQKPGMVFTRYQLIDTIHNSLITERAIDFHIVKLRKKLGHCGEYIETVHGIGYRFKD